MNMINGRRKEIYREILQLAESYCGKKIMARFLENQKRASRMEARVLQRPGGNAADALPVPEESLEERISVDHILTLCREALRTEDRYQEVLLGVGNIYKAHSDYELAEKTFNDVLHYGRKNGSDELTAEALLELGDIYSRLGRWQESTRNLLESRSLAHKLGNVVTLARIDNILGTNLAEQGSLADAKKRFSKALRSADQSKQRSLGAMILMNLGIVHNIIGNWDEALAHFRRSLSLFEGTGEIIRIAEVHHNTGMSYASKKDFAAALQCFDWGIEYATRAGNPHLVGVSQLGKAGIYFGQEDLTPALALCNKALAHFESSDDRLGTADAYKLKGMILAAMKEYDLAMTYFQSSLRINYEFKNLLNQGETHFQMGLMQQARRHPADAMEAFKKAEKCFRAIGARSALEETRVKLSTFRRHAR
jgi:tetratricopeptide (TPR) repeat protein